MISQTLYSCAASSDIFEPKPDYFKGNAKVVEVKRQRWTD
jgi:hypothetical protein